MKFILLKAELLHNRSKTLFNIFLIAIAVTVFIAFKTITHSYKVSMEKPFQKLGTNIIIQKVNKHSQQSRPMDMRGIRIPFSNAIISKKEFEAIKEIPEIDEISKSLLVWDMSKGKFKTILGIDPSDPSIGAAKIKEWVVKGRFPQKQNEIVLEKHFAKFEKKKLGNEFLIGDKQFTVVGLAQIKEGNQLASANVYMLHSHLSAMLNKNDGVNSIYVTLKDGGKIDDVKNKIISIAPNAKISTSNSFLESTSGMILILEKFSLLITLITAIITFILILKVQFSSFAERIYDIGVLKAIGWTNRETRNELVLESVVQNIFGCFIGFIFAMILCWLISFISVDFHLSGLVPPSKANQFAGDITKTTLPFVILPQLYALVLLVSIGIGVICGYLMGNKALKIKPTEVLRTV